MSSDDFINRERELNEVRERIFCLGVEGSKLINFYAIPGMGRTSLLNALRGCYQDESCYSTFVSLSDERYVHPEFNKLAILIDMAKCLETQTGIEPTEFYRQAYSLEILLKSQEVAEGRFMDDEQSRFQREMKEEMVTNTFRDYVNEITLKTPVLLLFDDIERNQTVKDWLEMAVLGPLMVSDRVVTVVTSRRPVHWKELPVRRRARECKLLPFSPEMIAKQIPQYAGLADEIYGLTFGHPYSNYIIAEKLKELEKREEIDREAFFKYRNRLMEYLVDTVIYPYIMKDVEGPIIEVFRMMAPLRGFDVEMLKDVLSSAVPDSFSGKSWNHFLSIFRGMVDTGLIEWDSDRKYYTIDSTLRKMLALHLELQDRDLYTRVNESALKKYSDLVEKVQRRSDVYIPEILYHSILLSAEKRSEEIRRILERELNKYLRRFYQKDAKGAYALLEVLRGDEDLGKFFDSVELTLPIN